MTSSGVEIPAASQSLYGKSVGDMIENDMEVLENGDVRGTFKYVTGYTGFNTDVPVEQEGYFFPFTLKKSGTTMTFKKNGVVSKRDIPWEANNVFRVTASDTFTVLVDGAEAGTFHFNNSVFQPEAKSVKARTKRNA